MFTVIEGARVATAKIYAERALTTAMDSVLAEYYGPLWEEYHILGYYPGDVSVTDRREKLEALLEEYMSYTFYPDTGLEKSSAQKGTEFYNISAGEINIGKEAALTDYEGELFAHEASEYMKYQVVGNGFESLLNKLSLLETPAEVSYIMEEKLKVEDELAEIDRGILELMELIDGIETSSKGIETDSGGDLRTTDTFVKKICYDPITQETVGINHERIFLALKNRYVNPGITFESIRKDFAQIENNISLCELLKEEKKALETKREQARTLLTELSTSGDQPDEEKARRKELKKEIAFLDTEISGYKEEIERLNHSLSQLAAELKAKQVTIIQLTDQMIPKLEKAGSVIDNILLMTQKAAPLVEGYEELLNEEKELIDPSFYNRMQEELIQIKKYVSTGKGNYNFQDMKHMIAEDLEVLITTQYNLITANEKLEQGLYQQAYDSCHVASEALMTYCIEDLELDYSTLVLDRTGQKAPLETIRRLINDGLTGLVVKEDTISEAEINSIGALPSELAELGADSSDCLADLLLFFQNRVTGQGKNGTGELFTGFGDETQLLRSVGDSVDELTECMLLQEYLKEHFVTYQPNPKLKNSHKPSVLEYEQEYLIVGNMSDEKNLSSVISRIILLRTVFDFVSILGDKSIQTEAKVLATSMVGFTGMPMLISLTKILILLLWSFAEALLDTCALMLGKEIPILKKNIMLQLPELFLINREYLRQKASGIKATKELSFSYQDYLRIFLIMTWKGDLTYRSMDLIQENLKLRYQSEGFLMTGCLYGFEAEANFRIESKFTAFPFVRELINGETGNFRYLVNVGYSY